MKSRYPVSSITKFTILSFVPSGVVVLPIWASGLSIQKTVLYMTVLSVIHAVVRANWSKPTPRAISLLAGLFTAIFLVQSESTSIVTFEIRMFFIALIFVSLLLFGAPKVFRVVVINVSILFALLTILEIGFRFMVQSQASSQYEVIELFRSGRQDGPGKGEIVSINTDRSGLRVTTDQPASPLGRVLFFGGSTTFCGEVEDSDTYPSQLQRLISSAGFNMRVENYGKSAATATDRVEILQNVADLSSNDVVVFYIGVNEAGVGFTQRDLPVQFIQKVPEFGTALQKASSYSRIADVLFRSLVFGGVSVTEESKIDAVEKLNQALDEAEAIALRAGARFVPVLQANLFTKVPRSEYDADLGSLYGSQLEPVVIDIYARMKDVVSVFPFAGDATGVMNDLEISPYYDWHHVNVSGNEEIAKYLFEHLAKQEVLK